MEYLATNFHKRRVQQILSMYSNADEILNKSNADENDFDDNELVEEIEKGEVANDEITNVEEEEDDVEKALSELGSPLM